MTKEKKLLELTNDGIPVAIYVRCDELNELYNDEQYQEHVEKLLAIKEKSLKKICKSRGYKVVKVYKDYPLSEWEDFGFISDGVRLLLMNSFDCKFKRVVFTSIYELDFELEIASSVLTIIDDNGLCVETLNEGIFNEDFFIENNSRLVYADGEILEKANIDNNEEETKVFAYLRTSTDNYDEIIIQKEIINAYCRKHGYKVVKFYEDLNVSADENLKPKLEEMLDDIQDSNVSVIITKNIDILSSNYTQLFDYVNYAEQIGYKIIETVENGIIDSDNFDIYFHPHKTRKSI